MLQRFLRGLLCTAALLCTFALIGCNQPLKEQAKGKPEAKSEKKGDGKKDITKEETKHEGWWCDEHGMPEDDCIMCNPKKKAAAKKSGDWCEHKRAKSQCFACDPKLKDFYAAQYKAKYPGKEPPPAEDNK